MRFSQFSIALALSCVGVGLNGGTAIAQQAAHSTENRRPIYDTKADGAKQIDAALKLAQRQRKNVLLQFGANWCIWCHRLHELCESDPKIAATLKNNFVVVLVDVDQKHNEPTDRKYGNPTQKGLPAIVVLDRSGKQLVTQDTGKLEEGDHHDPAKVMAFLQKWLPVRGQPRD